MSLFPKKTGRLNFERSQRDTSEAERERKEFQDLIASELRADDPLSGVRTGRLSSRQINLQNIPKSSFVTEAYYDDVEKQVLSAYALQDSKLSLALAAHNLGIDEAFKKAQADLKAMEVQIRQAALAADEIEPQLYERIHGTGAEKRSWRAITPTRQARAETRVGQSRRVLASIRRAR